MFKRIGSELRDFRGSCTRSNLSNLCPGLDMPINTLSSHCIPCNLKDVLRIMHPNLPSPNPLKLAVLIYYHSPGHLLIGRDGKELANNTLTVMSLSNSKLSIGT